MSAGGLLADSIEPEFRGLLPWAEAVRRFGAPWTRLVVEGGFNPSLDPGWIAAIGTSLNALEDLQVLVDVSGGQLRLVAPFIDRRGSTAGIPVRERVLGSNLMSYHAEVVSSGEPSRALRQVLDEPPGWDVFQAANILSDGPTAAAIRSYCAGTGARAIEQPVDVAAYLPLQTSWDELVASKGKKFRYKLRRRRSTLGDRSDLKMLWLNTRSEAPRLLDDILAVEAKSWKAEAGSAIVDGRPEAEYYRLLIPFLADRDALLANVLYVGELPIAYSLACSWQGWVGQLKTAFNQAFEDISPGAMVIDAAIEAASDSGAREFDFLGTPGKARPEPHKMAWTDHVRHHSNFFVFSPRGRGRLIGTLKDWKRALVTRRGGDESRGN